LFLSLDLHIVSHMWFGDEARAGGAVNAEDPAHGIHRVSDLLAVLESVSVS